MFTNDTSLNLVTLSIYGKNLDIRNKTLTSCSLFVFIVHIVGQEMQLCKCFWANF